MKITAVGAGSRGDMEPLVHLGKEMKRRGHAFKVVCLPRFKEYVEANGLEFTPVDFDGDYMMRAMLTECADGIAYINGMKEVYRRNPEMMDQVYEACKGADLILYILLGGFAHHAAEVLGIPCVRCFFYPFDKTNRYNIMLADVKEGSFINGLVYTGSEFTMNLVTKDLLNDWRQQHGLKKWGLFSDYRKMKGVIHHGGAGTTAASLRAGVPTQVLSFGGDQYFWGMRVHEAGAGPKPLDNEHKGWSVADMKNAILELVSGKYDQAAKELGEKLCAEDGCGKAADILERYWESRNSASNS